MRIPRASRSDSGDFGEARARFAQLRARGRAESCEFARRADGVWLTWEEQAARAARICARGGAKWEGFGRRARLTFPRCSSARPARKVASCAIGIGWPRETTRRVVSRGAAAPTGPPAMTCGTRACGGSNRGAVIQTARAQGSIPAPLTACLVESNARRDCRRRRDARGAILLSVQACGASSLAAAGFGPACVASSRAG